MLQDFLKIRSYIVNKFIAEMQHIVQTFVTSHLETADGIMKTT
jgi:hypothetical protein